MAQQPWLSNWRKVILRLISLVSQWMSAVAAIALGLMMLLSAADAGGRYLFSFPIKGAYELIGFLLVCAGTWGMADCEMQGSHVTVNILVDRLPPRVRLIISVVAYIISLVAFSLITWQAFVRGGRYIGMPGEVSEVLGIPFWPFIMVLGVGFGMLCLALFIRLVQALWETIRC
jgi:TRAP-type C4-dicarboxylate transport system permease small subunit